MLLAVVALVATAASAQAGINAWTRHGPQGAYVTALVIDRLAPSSLYAGTNVGVLRSTDAGATWTATGLTVAVNVLAIDPLTPSTLYAGTANGGLFKSTDAGATWNVVFCHITALAIDPSRPIRCTPQRAAKASSRARTGARPGTPLA